MDGEKDFVLTRRGLIDMERLWTGHVVKKQRKRRMVVCEIGVTF